MREALEILGSAAVAFAAPMLYLIVGVYVEDVVNSTAVIVAPFCGVKIKAPPL